MQAIVVAAFDGDEGMRSFVTEGADGFHVSLKDCDADEFVSIVLIFPTKERAVAKAREMVGR